MGLTNCVECDCLAAAALLHDPLSSGAQKMKRHFIVICFLAVCFWFPPGVNGAELRTWTSKSGKFTVKAELLSFDQRRSCSRGLARKSWQDEGSIGVTAYVRRISLWQGQVNRPSSPTQLSSRRPHFRALGGSCEVLEEYKEIQQQIMRLVGGQASMVLG